MSFLSLSATPYRHYCLVAPSIHGYVNPGVFRSICGNPRPDPQLKGHSGETFPVKCEKRLRSKKIS
jgi:hypothetical protein